jgi:hypothetical protein
MLNAATLLLDVQARPGSEVREFQDIANAPARVSLSHERNPSRFPLTRSSGPRLLERDRRSFWLGNV